MSDYEVAEALKKVASSLTTVGEALNGQYVPSVAKSLEHLANSRGPEILADAVRHASNGIENIRYAINNLAGATRDAAPFAACTGANPDVPLPAATFRVRGDIMECGRFHLGLESEVAALGFRKDQHGCYSRTADGALHFIGPCPFYHEE